MSEPKVHYRFSANVIEARNRVAVYCGAITHAANPQQYVIEASDPARVTCKNCLNRLEKEDA